jgi:Usher syndrome type-1G protein
LKEVAKKNSEKRAKEYATRQQRIEQEADREMNTMPHRPSNVLQAWKHKILSTSQSNLRPTGRDQQQLQNVTKFSALVGGTITGSRGGAVQKKANAIKLKNQLDNGDFKIGEVEAGGRRSVRSLQGLRRDSEILYVGTYDNAADNPGKRGKITDVFDVETMSEEEYDNTESGDKYGTLSRSYSQPDFLAASAKDDIAEDVMLQRPSGLFDRPMLGTLAFP